MLWRGPVSRLMPAWRMGEAAILVARFFVSGVLFEYSFLLGGDRVPGELRNGKVSALISTEVHLFCGACFSPSAWRARRR